MFSKDFGIMGICFFSKDFGIMGMYFFSKDFGIQGICFFLRILGFRGSVESGVYHWMNARKYIVSIEIDDISHFTVH